MDIGQNNFAEEVKALRCRLKLTQTEFARTLGVSFATVNRWENGKTRPSKLARRQFNELCARTTGDTTGGSES